jgi:hypothetical protein
MKISTFGSLLIVVTGCQAVPPAPTILPSLPPGQECIQDPPKRAACPESNFMSHVVYGVIESVERREEPVMAPPTFERTTDCRTVRPGIVMTLRVTESWMPSSPRLDDRIEVVLQSLEGLPAVAIEGDHVEGQASLVAGTSVGMRINGPVDGFYREYALFTVDAEGRVSHRNLGCNEQYQANTKAEFMEALAKCPSGPPSMPLAVAVCFDAEPEPEGCNRDSECGAMQLCDAPTRRCVP